MELLVVNYHYFREDIYPSGIYPISRKIFLTQVEQLAKRYIFISQTELIRCIKNNNYPDGKYCLLTFDDGLKEQMEAFRLLQSKGIPAVFFIPTDPIAHDMVLDVHQLHFIRSQKADTYLYEMLDVAYHISTYSFDMDDLKIQYRYDNELGRKVKYFLNFELGNVERTAFIRRAFNELGQEEASFSRQLYMDQDDLIELSAAGALGSHGSSHRPLAQMSYQEARQDILQSIHTLEKWTGQPVQSFSYPYGGKTAVDENLGSILKETQVAFALTMQRGVNTTENFQNPFFLKRIDTNDAPGEKFKSTAYC